MSGVKSDVNIAYRGRVKRMRCPAEDRDATSGIALGYVACVASHRVYVTFGISLLVMVVVPSVVFLPMMVGGTVTIVSLAVGALALCSRPPTPPSLVITRSSYTFPNR